MVTFCRASKPRSTECFCCLVIAKFPRAWDGKAEACCTIRVNHPGGETTSGSSAIATFLFLIPTLPAPARRLNVRRERACSEPSRAPDAPVMQVVAGRNFPAIPKDQACGALQCCSKADWSPLRHVFASRLSCVGMNASPRGCSP